MAGSKVTQLAMQAKSDLRRQAELAADPSSATLADVYRAVSDLRESINAINARLDAIEQTLKRQQR